MQALRRLPAPVTADTLAADLHVSRRTIYRDIEALRAIGAVIDGEAGYGYRLIEDNALPPLGFETDELEALVLGLREVQQIGDADLAHAAGTALTKLQARLPASQSQRLSHAVLTAQRYAKPHRPSINVKALRQATWDEVVVAFQYRDAQGIETQRQVKPLGLSYLDRSTVMVAWCLLRSDFRVFRLDRMSDLVRTTDSFRPHRVPLLRQAVTHIRQQIAQKSPDADLEQRSL